MESELKVKISDVLGRYLKDVPMAQDRAIALVDDLADLLSRPTQRAADGLESSEQNSTPVVTNDGTSEDSSPSSARR